MSIKYKLKHHFDTKAIIFMIIFLFVIYLWITPD